MHRLLQTSAIRLSLRYSLLYILIAGCGLTALYWATSRYVDAQMQAGLQHHLQALRDLYDTEGVVGIAATLNANELKTADENHRFLLYVDKSGSKIAGDLKGWPRSARTDGRVRNIWIEDDLIPHKIKDHDGYWPSIAATFPDGSRLLIAQSVRSAEDLQEFILATLFAILLTIIGLTLIVGWRMGRQMLARIDEVNSTAGIILNGRLDGRIPVSGSGDEFDELARNLNAMLDHIDRLIHGMHQVTDNVAHDLRRPLTRLRNRLDVTLLEPRDAAAYRETLEQTRTDIEDVLKTFHALLEIAQAESGHFRGEMTTLNLSALIGELGEMYGDFFDEHGQQLLLQVDPDCCVHGNRQLLAQLISNLLENAHKYAGGKAQVKLRLERKDADAVLSVIDDGPGIPADRVQDVLRRYVRLDAARSTAGSGLGLSLVRAVAELHGAVLLLNDGAPGLVVSLRFSRLPCLPEH